MGGVREGVLEREPSWAADGSVGRFKGREKQEEALCQLRGSRVDPHPTPHFCSA